MCCCFVSRVFYKVKGLVFDGFKVFYKGFGAGDSKLTSRGGFEKLGKCSRFEQTNFKHLKNLPIESNMSGAPINTSNLVIRIRRSKISEIISVIFESVDRPYKISKV